MRIDFSPTGSGKSQTQCPSPFSSRNSR